MGLTTAPDPHLNVALCIPAGRVHAHVAGMVQTLCGFSLFGQVPPFHTISWADNPAGLLPCGECTSAAATL